MGIFIVFGIICVVINIIIISSSNLSKEEKFMLRHGDIYDAVSVLADHAPQNTEFGGKLYSPEERDEKLLEEGGWRCDSCGKILASYVGSCGCGRKKNEIKKVSKHQIAVKKDNDKDQISVDNNKENDNVELLIKYNNLLQNGIITQEEYETKKKEILTR